MKSIKFLLTAFLCVFSVCSPLLAQDCPDQEEIDHLLTLDGLFTGPSFTHIQLSTSEPGEAWVCVQGDCGPFRLGVYGDESAPGTLTDGSLRGHDYLYFLQAGKYTASRPLNPFTP